MSRLFRKKDDLPKRSLWQRVKDAVRTDFGVLLRGGVDQGSLEALETLLIESDFGVPTSLVAAVFMAWLVAGSRWAGNRPAAVATWVSGWASTAALLLVVGFRLMIKSYGR